MSKGGYVGNTPELAPFLVDNFVEIAGDDMIGPLGLTTWKINGVIVTPTASEFNTLDGLLSSTTELNHSVGVSSNIQTQFDNIGASLSNKLETSLKGANNGLAELDGSGKVPQLQLPSIALTDSSVVASEAAMLLLSAQTGDVAIRTDGAGTFILSGTDPSILGDWSLMNAPTDVVTSVAGNVGAVTATDLLNAIKTVDGSGSLLDADLLDGQHASAFAGSGHNHDSLYYTKTLLDSGQLDNRYYTETEVDSIVTNNTGKLLVTVGTAFTAQFTGSHFITIVGGGGGGGPVNVSGGVPGGGGAGGGVKIFTVFLTLGQNYSYSIGAGGGGGLGANGGPAAFDGQNGDSTTFNGITVAGGGGAPGEVRGGGAGGGNAGLGGGISGGNAGAATGSSGEGGGSPFGIGGNIITSFGDGLNGSGYGAGGSGAKNSDTFNGGNGSQGVIIIEW